MRNSAGTAAINQEEKGKSLIVKRSPTSYPREGEGRGGGSEPSNVVIPAQAGLHPRTLLVAERERKSWDPAFAGVTANSVSYLPISFFCCSTYSSERRRPRRARRPRLWSYYGLRGFCLKQMSRSSLPMPY